VVVTTKDKGPWSGGAGEAALAMPGAGRASKKPGARPGPPAPACCGWTAFVRSRRAQISRAPRRRKARRSAARGLRRL